MVNDEWRFKETHQLQKTSVENFVPEVMAQWGDSTLEDGATAVGELYFLEVMAQWGVNGATLPWKRR